MQKNQIIHGDSVIELSEMAAGSVDLIVTDPPYLVNYKDRTGRTLKNDNNADGVLPVFEPMARVLKDNAYCICFCGWSALPKFTAAWEAAGLRIVGQIIWKKRYASRKGYTEYRHETAYVLAKGNPSKPSNPLSDVQDWVYSGNKRHPTEKAVEVIAPLIRCFSKEGDLVLDPFSGSGSTSVWGQDVGFETQAAGMALSAEMNGMFGIGATAMPYLGFSVRVVDSSKPFLSETGYRRFLGVSVKSEMGMTTADFVRRVVELHVENELKGELLNIGEQYRVQDG